jgi:tetratricopeptide (TPR) repeat protein
LMFRRGIPPEAEYTFKHALVQDTAYSTLLRGRRQKIHARIVEALESQFPEIVVAQPHLMAQHCTEAGLINEAIDFWAKAGRISYARFAIVEASLQIRKGLALLCCLTEGPERWRKELKLLSVLGWTEFVLKGEGASEVGETLSRTRFLCDQLGHRSSLEPRALYMQASHHMARAEYAAARQVAEELQRFALERKDAALEALGHYAMGRNLKWLGAFSSAAEHLECMLHVPATETDELVKSVQPICLAYLAHTLLLLGHVDRAADCCDQALELAKKENQPYTLALVLNLAFGVDWLLASPQAAVEHLTELASLAEKERFPLALAMTDLGLAMVRCERGKTSEGFARARRADAELTRMGISSGRTSRLWVLAYCCQRAGEIDDALKLLETALETANTTDERQFEAELHRLRGECFLAHHSAGQAEAERELERALVTSRRQGAHFWELRAAMNLARLWYDQGKRVEARNLLAPIYGLFTEGFDTPVLKGAKALLDELT